MLMNLCMKPQPVNDDLSSTANRTTTIVRHFSGWAFIKQIREVSCALIHQTKQQKPLILRPSLLAALKKLTEEGLIIRVVLLQLEVKSELKVEIK